MHVRMVTHFQCFLNLAIILPFSPSGSINSIFCSLMNTTCMNFHLDMYVYMVSATSLTSKVQWIATIYNVSSN